MPLYATKAAAATTSDLYTLNPATAVATSIGPTGHAFTGLAFDPTTDILYGVTSPNDGDVPSRNSLFTIDMTTGAATLVGAISGGAGVISLSDIAFDSSGQLYGYGAATGNLHVVNKSTGGYTTVTLGLGASNAALSFDGADVLYLVARVFTVTGLYTIDVGTGGDTLLGTLDPASSLRPSALSYGSDGDLWWLNGGGGGSGVRLRTLDIATQAWTIVVDSPTAPGDDFDGLVWAGAIPVTTFTTIKFGDGLKVTDEGGGVIRVDLDLVLT